MHDALGAVAEDVVHRLLRPACDPTNEPAAQALVRLTRTYLITFNLKKHCVARINSHYSNTEEIAVTSGNAASYE